MRLALSTIASVTLLVFSTALLAAQSTQSAPTPSTLNAQADRGNPADSEHASLTKADVEAWLDGFMPYALRQGDVAGAVVVVVKNGEVLVQRGYGYADVVARTPVDPDRTLFRPGSISKLLTWTAVMQLVEQGKLDLDADVNTYLDFNIPSRQGQPITLRNIMSHTPGFEEYVQNIFGVEADGVQPLEIYLKRWIPTRIFAPAQMPAYSNYATSLAGYVVARVSGVPFDDYVEKYLFEPLGMQSSSFRQPLPERLRADMSKGYIAASLPEQPYEIVGPAPAGSLAATGADMARFMIAHLQKGAYGERRILRAETAEQMHTSALTILPRVNRMMLGFYETNYNGRRIIGHGGDTQWFHSYLHLFVDDGVGLYVSSNSLGKEGASVAIRGALFQQFADRYLPGPTLEGEVEQKLAAEHARMIAGNYTSSRRIETSFASLTNLFGETTVTDNGDGTISFSMLKSPSGTLLKLREVEPFVWRQENSERLLAAKVQDGRVAMFSFDDVSPFMMFTPPDPWKAAGWLLPTFAVGLVIVLLTCIAWPVAALTRRHYRVQYALVGTDALAHRWVRIAATTVIAGWLAWAVTGGVLTANTSARLGGWLLSLQAFTLIAFCGAAGLGVWNAYVVIRSARTWYAKTWAVLLALSFLAILWVGFVYRMFTFDVSY